MEPSKLKTEVSTSEFEMETHRLDLQAKIRLCRMVEISRAALTTLALMAGIAVLGLSADALKVYNATHVSPEYLLPLWPDHVDLRPTNALVAAGSIAVVVNVVCLLASKVHAVISLPGPDHRTRQEETNMAPQLRNRILITTSIGLAAPLIALIAAITAVALSYAVNPSGHTVQSWACRWRQVPMQSRPFFGTLCTGGQVALDLAVLLIPLEAIVLGVAAHGASLRHRIDVLTRERDAIKGSPALS